MSREVLPPGVAVNQNHIEDRDAYSKDLDNGLALSHDELQLRAQGHVAELPRRFSWLATLALAFSITNTWIGYSATFVVPLLAGAGRAVVCCLILACVASTIIAAGLAELASAFPSSGGQYHFTFMVSGPSYRAPAAFFVGWLSSLGWIFTTASTVAFCSQNSLVLASMYHPAFEPTRWQIFLVYLLITVVSCAIICWGARWVPTAEKAFLAISLLGFAVATVTVLAVSDHKQPAAVVFSNWDNQSGWPDGVGFLLATGQAMYGFLGMDGATHIAEEVPHPGRVIPIVLMLIMGIGSVSAIIWTIAFMFSTTDLDQIASSTIPIFTVFEQASNSRAVATFFLVWIIVVYYGALVSCFVTAGRLLWAFSRDDGLPYSQTFAKVSPKYKAPINSTILAGACISLLGVLYIASTTAFNSIAALAILSSNITCTVPQTIVLIRGRHVLPERSLKLGKILGPACATFSTLYVTLFVTLFCFPTSLPVTLDTMNYVSVVLVGAMILITILWLSSKRHRFTGPALDGLETLASITEIEQSTTLPKKA
ncbi:hypothetical protein Q7P37_010385 [Cladosporium fusiforme]